MEESIVHLHTAFRIGDVDPRLFGGFVEHLGRAVYGGVYDPTSAHADEDGFRTDVMTALRNLHMTVMRYPGGNFASGYHWMDGVGPPEHRPTVLDLAWQTIETNAFGTDEFLRLCRKMDWTPMLTVNLGTGTPEEARNWVEYCNAPPGTRYADMRADNGQAEPYGVPLWCLGNEMDGQWQLGHVPAEVYAQRAREAAMMMRNVDPSIQLAACGSSGVGMPTYLDWDRTVLEYVWDLVDYVSIHQYIGNRDENLLEYLAASASVGLHIEETDAVCRYIRARVRSRKRIRMCFDEWNVWYRNTEGNGHRQPAPSLLEEKYNLEDALAVAGFLHAFIRHADVVKIANLAQIVNVIAPVLTRGDELLLQTIFYPFMMFSRRRDGTALRTAVEGPGYESSTWGPLPLLDTSAVINGPRVHVFITNRCPDGPMEVAVDVSDGDIAALESAELLTGPDPKAGNTFDNPNVVRAEPWRDVIIKTGRAIFRMPPLSFAACTFRLD